LSDTEEQLLAYVPEGLSTGCLPARPRRTIHGERASLVCRTADLEVLYELFQTRDEMNDAFQVNVNNKAAPDGNCAIDHLACGPYTIDGTRAGSVLCYTLERGSFLVPAAAAIAYRMGQMRTRRSTRRRIRNDLGDLSLYEWWLTSSGPRVPAEGTVAGQGLDVARSRRTAARTART
jgi:hypothetical protein